MSGCTNDKVELVNFFDHVIEKKDYITGNGFIEACHQLDITFSNIDYVSEGFREISQRPGDQIFVTHQSDFSATSELYSQMPQNIKIWFAQNCEELPKNSKAIGIPIGLNNLTVLSNATSKFGKYSSGFGHITDYHQNLYVQNEKTKTWQNLCYANFSTRTFSSERAPLWDWSNKLDWITQRSSTSHLEFANDVYNHPFVLSPRGNGYDCVRTWEAIYLRSIPIVKKSVPMSHFGELPILFIDDWNQITEEFLLDKLDEFKCKKFDMSKAKMSYWKTLLRELK